MDIAEIFNSYAGKEIQVEKRYVFLSFGKRSYTYGEVKPVKNDPVLKAMQRAAREKGLTLRLWFSESSRSCDYRQDRVNVHVTMGEDGKYRVSDRFMLG
ncbi:MAG: hypothetical protein KGL10_06200 [Alphaproteobacteria bacterium]|nr:hypothetical protein [Alphaproteobacteria bacterium]MDE2336885.1 hypothetical protein [Alphaproteobacteria bacterium]